ncbi:Endoribonuclease YbeY [Porphyridium purpureum]|uniref:Endoribonuclease YbeY n=1 Tax=Porphyridium purpureum TaxID=35688 RepID=A0A5J4Z7K6_PORPP|nr:Endoribonuclease YbeY [Porphyridium purpureum]|eukprot:POR2814..scf295_1
MAGRCVVRVTAYSRRGDMYRDVASDMTAMKAALGYANYAVAVWLCGESRMKRLNWRYRRIRKSTDVLSFGFAEVQRHAQYCLGGSECSASEASRLAAGEQELVDVSEGAHGGASEKDAVDLELGELVVSVPRCEHDARTLGVSSAQHMRSLLAHGLCHLMGHDHESDAEHVRMRECEARALDAIGACSTVG